MIPRWVALLIGVLAVLAALAFGQMVAALVSPVSSPFLAVGNTVSAYGDRRVSYSEFGAEATRPAHALRVSGVQPGDRVAYVCPNIPEMLVANFGVPLAGAVLVPINTSLSAEEVRYICDHSGARMLVIDTEYLSALAPDLDSLRTVVEVVAITDPLGLARPMLQATPAFCTTSSWSAARLSRCPGRLRTRRAKELHLLADRHDRDAARDGGVVAGDGGASAHRIRTGCCSC